MPGVLAGRRHPGATLGEEQGHRLVQREPGRVYSFSGNGPAGKLACVELATGALKWETRDLGNGSLVLVDGCLLCLTYAGSLVLVEARPDTGRTHQIRIHLAQLGHPVLGDVLYGPQTVDNPFFRAIPRQMLHAAFLAFRDPGTGKRVELEAPLPRDMRRVLAGLRGPG